MPRVSSPDGGLLRSTAPSECVSVQGVKIFALLQQHFVLLRCGPLGCFELAIQLGEDVGGFLVELYVDVVKSSRNFRDGRGSAALSFTRAAASELGRFAPRRFRARDKFSDVGFQRGEGIERLLRIVQHVMPQRFEVGGYRRCFPAAGRAAAAMRQETQA